MYVNSNQENSQKYKKIEDTIFKCFFYLYYMISISFKDDLCPECGIETCSLHKPLHKVLLIYLWFKSVFSPNWSRLQMIFYNIYILDAYLRLG